MAFTRPTLSELVDRIEQDFISRLSLTGALLRRAVVRILSRVIAGAAHMAHGHLDWLARQIFADTAETENLERIGTVFGVERTAAQFAEGAVVLTGVNTSVAPAGTVLLRSDGVEYTTDADATITAGTATVNVTASVAAEDGNADADVELTFESPIAGIDSTATVDTDGLEGGADQEDIETYRLRVLERIRAAPHGGNAADYEAWAKEVAGVTRVWVAPQEAGVGTVTVRFVRDDDASIIPDAGEVSDVQDYLDDLRPVTSEVFAVAPVASVTDFTISGLVPDTAAVKLAIAAELEDLILRTAEPGSPLYLSAIRTAIGSAEGVTDYVLDSPVADVTHTTNQIPTMGSVFWV